MKYLKAAISYVKEKRVETYPFAREAVREAVYNALVHCKWEDGIPVQIRIEDKAMYISNSCVFPSDWTAENLMKTHTSRPYNPDIANTFFRAGYIEAWGRGVQKICEEYDKIGAANPEYSIVGNDITVKLTAVFGHKSNVRKENVQKENRWKDHIMNIISQNSNITIAEISRRLEVSDKTISRAIDWLKSNGYLDRAGGRKSGNWIIKKK